MRKRYRILMSVTMGVETDESYSQLSEAIVKRIVQKAIKDQAFKLSGGRITAVETTIADCDEEPCHASPTS